MGQHPIAQCVILKPLAAFSWRKINAVSVIGFYSMVGISEAHRSEYLKRVDESTSSLLKFARKDLAVGANVEWETAERTMDQMAEMGSPVDSDSSWAVLVGMKVELSEADPTNEAANSFRNAWIPRLGAVMQFHVPFDDAPSLSFLDGDEGFALVLAR